MNIKPMVRLLVVCLILMSALALGALLPAQSVSYAAPAAQMTEFPTPTPGPDGKIIYIVQPGDTLWRIAAIAGISVQELAAMNGLEADTVLAPGMRLELGVAGPAQPTSAPLEDQPTSTGVPVTPTPISGMGEICVLLFDDTNGNGRLDTTEFPLVDGQISVTSVDGTVIGEHTTIIDPADEDLVGYCFVDVENGDYNVSAALPEDYNATTTRSIPVSLAPGETAYIAFGAQSSTALIRFNEGNSGSTLLGGVGIVFLLLAGGLGFLAYRSSRPPTHGLR